MVRAFRHELLSRRRRRSIDRTSRRVEQHPVASTHDPQRNQHIVENRVRRDRLEQRAADRVDGAGRADRGVRAALVPAHELLVAPVEAHAVAGRRRSGAQHQLAADRADRRVGEIRDQGSHRAGLEPLPGVGEHDDLSARGAHDVVEHRGFAPAA